MIWEELILSHRSQKRREPEQVLDVGQPNAAQGGGAKRMTH